MATQYDTNPYKKNDKVQVDDKRSFLYGNKGVVKSTFGGSVEVLIDDNITVVIYYTRLKKVKVNKNVRSKRNKKAS